jgi:hypothetical protein
MGLRRPSYSQNPSLATKANSHNHLPSRIAHHMSPTKQNIQNVWGAHQHRPRLQRTLHTHHQGRSEVSLRTHKCHSLLTSRNTFPTDFTYRIQPTDALLTEIPHGHNLGSQQHLCTSIDTLRFTQLFPADTPHRILPKDLSPTSTLTQFSWYAHI